MVAHDHLISQQIKLPRPRLLTPLGWYAVCGLLACVIGAALGFVATP